MSDLDELIRQNIQLLHEIPCYSLADFCLLSICQHHLQLKEVSQAFNAIKMDAGSPHK